MTSRCLFVFMLFVLFPATNFAAPGLVDKLEAQTGLPVTISQKEGLAASSYKKHVALKDAGSILVSQLSQILSLPEKAIRAELFSETGVPSVSLNPETGAKLERLLGREMTKTEYELVAMAFKAFKDKEASIVHIHADEVGNLVDLPGDHVREFISP